MHKNRYNMGKFWPVAKKGTKYVAKSSHNNSNSVPLAVLMRDVLKLVRTTKELKKVLNEKQIKVSGKEIRDILKVLPNQRFDRNFSKLINDVL